MLRDAKVVGLCRFSYLSESQAFQRGPDDIASRAEFLFDKNRLNFRINIFKKLCLASIASQKNKNFTFVVLASDRMPGKYKEQLLQICSSVAECKVKFLPPMPHSEAIVEAFNVGNENQERVIKFRLDDDDALSHNYVDNLLSLGSLPMAEPYVISFSRGVFVNLSNSKFEVYPTVARFLSVGQALVAPVSDTANIYDYRHRYVADKLKTIVDPTEPAYIRCFHPDMDSDGKLNAKAVSINEKDIHHHLQAWFPGISFNSLESLKF